MGLGPPILALYRQLKGLGAFDGISSVMELGAQNVWCPRAELVKNLFRAFDKPAPPQEMLDRFANWKGSAKELYTALGFDFHCIDVDPQFESIRLDLNFDECPPDHVGKYDFVTNHGTSEHLLNQQNFFKVVHELTKPGGLMLHAVPFTAHIEHGFFNYQPNFFEALARYNSYKLLGVWVGPGWQAASLVPWEPDILDYMVINSKTTHLLVALSQKMYDTPFSVPFQGVYEPMTPDEVMQRYSLIVDGEFYDGKRAKHITKETVIADKVAQDTIVLRNELASLQGQYWDVATRLATAEKEIGPLKSELAASLLRFETLHRELQTVVGSDVRIPGVQQETTAKIEAIAGKLERQHPRQSASALSGRELLSELGGRIRRRLFI
jgi:2-polyprenyl-3-methyl-5-hydroxy-6-metoxy-1,4-benzoquinol methylase